MPPAPTRDSLGRGMSLWVLQTVDCRRSGTDVRAIMGSTQNALLSSVWRAVPVGTRRGTRAQCAAGSVGGRSVAVWTEGRQDPALIRFLRPVPLLCSQGHCQPGTGGPRRQSLISGEAQCTALFPPLPALGGVCEPPHPGMAAMFAVAGSCGEAGPVLSRVGLQGAVSLETMKAPVCGHQSRAVGIGQGVGQGAPVPEWAEVLGKLPVWGARPHLHPSPPTQTQPRASSNQNRGPLGPGRRCPTPLAQKPQAHLRGPPGVKFGEQLCAGSPWTQARAVNLPVRRTLGRGSSFGQGGRGRAAAPRSPLPLGPFTRKRAFSMRFFNEIFDNIAAQEFTALPLETSGVSWR